MGHAGFDLKHPDFSRGDGDEPPLFSENHRSSSSGIKIEQSVMAVESQNVLDCLGYDQGVAVAIGELPQIRKLMR